MSYKNYSTFEDIDDVSLRTWNRCAMASNLLNDKGEEESRAYMEQFSSLEKKQMLLLFKYIEAKGYEATRAEVARNSGTMEA